MQSTGISLLAVVGIPRAHRLRHRREFAAVRARGRSYRNELLTLRALRTPEMTSRFAFTAGRPVGNAVARNKVKRRLREIVRALPVRQGWQLVLSARPAAASARFAQLRSLVQELLVRAGALGANER